MAARMIFAFIILTLISIKVFASNEIPLYPKWEAERTLQELELALKEEVLGEPKRVTEYRGMIEDMERRMMAPLDIAIEVEK